jgi:hypothetical protein
MTNDVGKLAPFTGYYAMTGAAGVAPGAFLSIDTTEEYVVAAGIQKTTTIVVNVSMDGKSLFASYPVGAGAAFDGKTLTVPGKLTLHFSRHYKDGQLVTFSGTIGDVDVNGGTYFNPAPLSAFVGDYFWASKEHPTPVQVLSLGSDTEILFDFSAFSENPTGQLKAVTSYSYVPAMFVLTFNNVFHSQPDKFMLMLGTASKFGLACSIQDGDSAPKFAPKMALSIL